ncbi:MAG: hypothetical protein AAFU64_20695, partial [Bacteroidota bacterium]
ELILGEESTLDVIANQVNSGLGIGGLAEFEDDDNDNLTPFDPVVAFQGSGTADAPHMILYLNTLGSSNIQITYNLRELDANNAVQQVALQYRIGSSGSFINIPAGYVLDASNGSGLVTNIDITLPAALENQAQVEVRIITSNASGSDSWIGIDDIQVVGGAGVNDSDSDVTNPLVQITPGIISSTSDTSDESVDIFSFRLQDQGSGDGFSTIVTNLRFIPGLGNTADWTDHLQGFTLQNGGDIPLGTPTITDSEINIPINAGELVIPDGGSTELTLGIYLNTSAISDGAIFSLIIDADDHGFIADGSGSTFASIFSEGAIPKICSRDFNRKLIGDDIPFRKNG